MEDSLIKVFYTTRGDKLNILPLAALRLGVEILRPRHKAAKTQKFKLCPHAV